MYSVISRGCAKMFRLKIDLRCESFEWDINLVSVADFWCIRLETRETLPFSRFLH